MLHAILTCLALMAFTGEAFAVTVSWTCNPEPDMKEYRVESSKDAGKAWGVEATWPHPKPCTSPITGQTAVTSFGIRNAESLIAMHDPFSGVVSGSVTRTGSSTIQ